MIQTFDHVAWMDAVDLIEQRRPLLSLTVDVCDANKKFKCTYIEVDVEEFTNETILIKPHWMWGAEMGINNKGLVIGNEAVFTRERLEPKALLGMDILRLALEYCDTAAKAVRYMIYLLEQYGQGGKAGYTENLRYHNSFIIADCKSAYVLETAGKNWAYLLE